MAKFTNTFSGFKHNPNRGSGIKNCAACSAAGAVNLTAGHAEQTSADAGNMTLHCPTGEQAKKISTFVKTKTGRQAEDTVEELSLGDAERWMQTFGNGTVFAINANGNVPHHNEDKCHWLNAILAGGTIRYFDFQSNRDVKSGEPFVGGANPSTSTRPFVGVITQAEDGPTSRKMHLTEQAGSFDQGVKLRVLAFPPTTS